MRVHRGARPGATTLNGRSIPVRSNNALQREERAMASWHCVPSLLDPLQLVAVLPNGEVMSNELIY
ncbi:MAG: hypothetical protein ACYCSS_00445 [Sulfuriferula sp.]